MKKANFWLRFLAYILDSLFIGFILEYLSVIFGLYPKMKSLKEMSQLIDNGNFSLSAIVDVNALILYSIIINLLIILYFAIFETSSLQATPFKRLFKIKVVDINGNRISFLRSFSRNFCKILSALILNIGFIIALFTKNGQALHDICARCIVVKKNE